MVPPPHVKAELEDFLRQDTTLLGKVFDLLEEGKSDEDICAELGISAGRLRRSKRLIDSILDGVLTTKGWVAQADARRFRSILKTPGLSATARRVLSHNLQILEDRASDMTTREAEPVVAKRATSQAEERGGQGFASTRSPITSGIPTTLIPGGRFSWSVETMEM